MTTLVGGVILWIASRHSRGWHAFPMFYQASKKALRFLIQAFFASIVFLLPNDADPACWHFFSVCGLSSSLMEQAFAFGSRLHSSSVSDSAWMLRQGALLHPPAPLVCVLWRPVCSTSIWACQLLPVSGFQGIDRSQNLYQVHFSEKFLKTLWQFKKEGGGFVGRWSYLHFICLA